MKSDRKLETGAGVCVCVHASAGAALCSFQQMQGGALPSVFAVAGAVAGADSSVAVAIADCIG